MLQKRYDLCILELPSVGKAKTLKFKGFKAQYIMEGEKTATMRLFDDKDAILDYLKLHPDADGKELCKELKPNQVVIMDNASFHKSSKVKNLIESAGATLVIFAAIFTRP